MLDLCTHINVGFFGINDDYRIENSTDKLHVNFMNVYYFYRNYS